jgi:hypothetical protein
MEEDLPSPAPTEQKREELWISTVSDLIQFCTLVANCWNGNMDLSAQLLNYSGCPFVSHRLFLLGPIHERRFQGWSPYPNHSALWTHDVYDCSYFLDENENVDPAFAEQFGLPVWNLYMIRMALNVGMKLPDDVQELNGKALTREQMIEWTQLGKERMRQRIGPFLYLQHVSIIQDMYDIQGCPQLPGLATLSTLGARFYVRGCACFSGLSSIQLSDPNEIVFDHARNIIFQYQPATQTTELYSDHSTPCRRLN